MTIWLLAILLIASSAALGYRQGAIRVAVSFIGIIVAALLCPMLGKFVNPLIAAFGVTNPVWPWFLGPIIVFVIISAAFKGAALPLHQKIDVHFRYHAGDLRQALWERVNRRVGLSLGILNGTLYLILVSFLIHTLSYWTYQVANADEDPKIIRILNRLGKDLDASGFDRVARAVDGMPETYYKAADTAGLLYHNPLLEARLSRYPAFLSLAESPEFQEMGANKEFLEMRHSRAALSTLLKQPSVATVMNKPDLLRTIWKTTVENLGDLDAYLKTGKSAKYDPQRLLGRWRFDVNFTAALMRKLRPNMGSQEMQRLKAWMRAAFDQTSIVAMTDGHLILKNLPVLAVPGPNAPAQTGGQTLQGTWKDLEGRYQLNLTGKDDIFATLEGGRLTMTVDKMPLAFIRED